MAAERIQKIIARAGLASRRAAETWIADGEVTINGKVAKPGDHADAGKDHIKIRGKLLLLKQTQTAPVYVLFYKPKGVISMVAQDASGRPTIHSFLPPWAKKLFPAGRLQYNEEGLVLLSNDGEFTQSFLKNKNIVRVFSVKVSGHPSRRKAEEFLKGTRMEGKRVVPLSFKISEYYNKATEIEVAFQGSGTIDLKTYCLRKKFAIERVRLQSIGQLNMNRLKAGDFLRLKKSQIDALLDHPELALRDITPGLTWREPGRKFQPVPDKADVK